MAGEGGVWSQQAWNYLQGSRWEEPRWGTIWLASLGTAGQDEKQPLGNIILRSPARSEDRLSPARENGVKRWQAAASATAVCPTWVSGNDNSPKRERMNFNEILKDFKFSCSLQLFRTVEKQL